MVDTCDVRFLSGAARSYRKILRTDADRGAAHRGGRRGGDGERLDPVDEQLIKVLDQKRYVGEIRDVGSGGYRLFFFWIDTDSTRMIFITAVEKKSGLKGKARVNSFVDAAAELRRRYLELGEEEA